MQEQTSPFPCSTVGLLTQGRHLFWSLERHHRRAGYGFGSVRRADEEKNWGFKRNPPLAFQRTDGNTHHGTVPSKNSLAWICFFFYMREFGTLMQNKLI